MNFKQDFREDLQCILPISFLKEIKTEELRWRLRTTPKGDLMRRTPFFILKKILSKSSFIFLKILHIKQKEPMILYHPI